MFKVRIVFPKATRDCYIKDSVHLLTTSHKGFAQKYTEEKHAVNAGLHFLQEHLQGATAKFEVIPC